MNQNPFEPIDSPAVASRRTTVPEKTQRIAFVASMWICGLAAIQFLPVYPWSPGYWAAKVVPSGVHWAWMAPFACSLASVATGLGLFSLPRLFDKIGAILGIVLVGLWPGLLAINWWQFFATR